MGARQMAPPPANGWSLLLGCLGESGDSNAKRETHSGPEPVAFRALQSVHTPS